jgi:hypothetical protein
MDILRNLSSKDSGSDGHGSQWFHLLCHAQTRSSENHCGNRGLRESAQLLPPSCMGDVTKWN